MKRISQMEPWLGEEEKNAVIKYMESGGWITEYKKTEEFEDVFKTFVNSKFASAVTNGTMSLVVGLLSLDLTSTDEVIVPDYTMIASANSVKLAGEKPILVDIDLKNLCLDLGAAEEKISDNTKAIVYVSINGRSHNMYDVIKFAKKYNLRIIEDASQSLGCYYDEKHLGTFSDIGTFSLSTPKVITTGQGGIVVTNDEHLYKTIEMIKDYGRPKSGVDYYEIMGYNFKFTDLQAVIGLEQMKKIKWRLQRKKEIYKLYYNELGDNDNIQFIDTDLTNTSPWFIDILIDALKRQSFIDYMKMENVDVRPFYPAIHTQPPYKNVTNTFLNADTISKRGVWLPSSSFLTDEDIKYVCLKINSFFKN